MIALLAYDEPGLAAALRSGPFRRAGLRLTTVASTSELLERAERLHPDVVVVVAGVVDPRTERSIERALRRRLAGHRTLVLLALPEERRAIEEDLRFYDGLLDLEDPELDLLRILEPLLNVQARREARSPVNIPALLRVRSGKPVGGIATDIGSAGAGLRLVRRPESDPCEVVFYRPDGRSVVLEARQAWIEETRDGMRLGVRFLGATLDAIRDLYDLAFWELVVPQGEPVIHLRGEFSERTSFVSLLNHLPSEPVFDLAEVTRVNSAGALRWIEFLQRASTDRRLRLRRVSAAVMRQMLLVPGMMQQCMLESFEVSFMCDDCDLEQVVLLEADRPGTAPACPDCSVQMIALEPTYPFDRSRRGVTTRTGYSIGA